MCQDNGEQPISSQSYPMKISAGFRNRLSTNAVDHPQHHRQQRPINFIQIKGTAVGVNQEQKLSIGMESAVNNMPLVDQIIPDVADDGDKLALWRVFYHTDTESFGMFARNKIRDRPADLKLGGVCGDMPAQCIANLIMFLCPDVRVDAVEMFGPMQGRAIVWVSDRPELLRSHIDYSSNDKNNNENENDAESNLAPRLPEFPFWQPPSYLNPNPSSYVKPRYNDRPVSTAAQRVIDKLHHRIWMAPLFANFAIYIDSPNARSYMKEFMLRLRAEAPVYVRFPRHLMTVEQWLLEPPSYARTRRVRNANQPDVGP